MVTTLTTRLLGCRPVTAAVRALTVKRLRIVCYHDVPDPRVFDRHVQHILRRYTPITGATVQEALYESRPLPDAAVWLTFDDGDPTVVEGAQGVLDAHGIPATMFVCPGVIGTASPLWWQTIKAALAAGISVELNGQRRSDLGVITTLKTVDDGIRRRVVQQAADAFERLGGEPFTRPQLSVGQISRWVAAGHEVGNHTWDHPCLDRCDPEEQVRQVTAAHEWLTQHIPARSMFFAYPNGNWSPHTDVILRRLGYRVALLFDHRLSTRRQNPMHLSRVAIDSDASPEVLRARLSGAFAAARAVRRGPNVNRKAHQ